MMNFREADEWMYRGSLDWTGGAFRIHLPFARSGWLHAAGNNTPGRSGPGYTFLTPALPECPEWGKLFSPAGPDPSPRPVPAPGGGTVRESLGREQGQVYPAL